MRDRTPHRLAALYFESEGAIVVKSNGSKRGLVNRHQTEWLLVAWPPEQFAIFECDVELKSPCVLIPANIGLHYVGANLGRRHRSCLAEHLPDLGILVIAGRCQRQRGAQRLPLQAPLTGQPKGSLN